MKRYIIFFICSIMGMALMAQNDFEYLIRKADDMFNETRYEVALSYYYEARNMLDEYNDALSVKIEKTEYCKDLMQQILRASVNGWKNEEESKLRELYRIHPSPLLKKKINEFDRMREEEAARIREEELREQALREEEERIQREEEERIRYEAERKKLEEKKRMEQKEWDNALASNSIVVYKKFIEKYPESQYKLTAIYKIKKLSEEQEWRYACELNTIAAYEKYIQNGGEKSYQAQAKIDKLYWEKAERGGELTDYEEYISRNTGANKAYVTNAKSEIDRIKQQKKIISDAQYIKDELEAYNYVYKARRLGKLPKDLEKQALIIEESYVYSQVKTSKASVEQKQSYLSKYGSVAPEDHLNKIRKQLSRKQTVVQSSTGKVIIVEKDRTDYQKNAYDPYIGTHGVWDVDWLGINASMGMRIGEDADGYDRFAVEFGASALRIRCNWIQLCPLEFSALMSLDGTDLSFYYNPVLNFVVPVKSDGAVFFGAGPRINLGGELKPWFKAEAGYRFNSSGMFSCDIFCRYSVILSLGITLHI